MALAIAAVAMPAPESSRWKSRVSEAAQELRELTYRAEAMLPPNEARFAQLQREMTELTRLTALRALHEGLRLRDKDQFAFGCGLQEAIAASRIPRVSETSQTDVLVEMRAVADLIEGMKPQPISAGCERMYAGATRP